MDSDPRFVLRITPTKSNVCRSLPWCLSPDPESAKISKSLGMPKPGSSNANFFLKDSWRTFRPTCKTSRPRFFPWCVVPYCAPAREAVYKSPVSCSKGLPSTTCRTAVRIVFIKCSRASAGTSLLLTGCVWIWSLSDFLPDCNGMSCFFPARIGRTEFWIVLPETWPNEDKICVVKDREADLATFRWRSMFCFKSFGISSRPACMLAKRYNASGEMGRPGTKGLLGVHFEDEEAKSLWPLRSGASVQAHHSKLTLYMECFHRMVHPATDRRTGLDRKGKIYRINDNMGHDERPSSRQRFPHMNAAQWDKIWHVTGLSLFLSNHLSSCKNIPSGGKPRLLRSAFLPKKNACSPKAKLLMDLHLHYHGFLPGTIKWF